MHSPDRMWGSGAPTLTRAKDARSREGLLVVRRAGEIDSLCSPRIARAWRARSVRPHNEHKLVPTFLFQQAEPFAMLSRPDATTWFDWRRSGGLVPTLEWESPTGLAMLPLVAGGEWMCAVVRTPPPREPAETHLVARVGRSDPSRGSLAARDPAYFRLEHGTA